MSFGFCERCVEGHELKNEITGSMQPNGAYFAPAKGGSPSRNAIILLTDILGLPLRNCKVLAAQYAERLGCDVWVPDMFNGNPIVKESELGAVLPDTPGTAMPLSVKLRFVWILLWALPKWLSNRGSVVDARVTGFVKKIKEEKKYAKLGVVGYCFGGSVIIRLGSKGLFDSAIIIHPGRCTLEDIKAINIPSPWICAEEDRSFGPELRAQAEAVFAERKDKPEFIEYEFRDYQGTCHGFAARPNLGNPTTKAAFDSAFTQAVEWFQKTL